MPKHRQHILRIRVVVFERWKKNLKHSVTDFHKVAYKALRHEFSFDTEQARVALMKWCQKCILWHPLLPEIDWVDVET